MFRRKKVGINPYALCLAYPLPTGHVRSLLEGLAEYVCERPAGLYFIILRDKFNSLPEQTEFTQFQLTRLGCLTIDDMFGTGAFPQDFVEKLKQYDILKPKRGFNH